MLWEVPWPLLAQAFFSLKHRPPTHFLGILSHAFAEHLLYARINRPSCDVMKLTFLLLLASVGVPQCVCSRCASGVSQVRHRCIPVVPQASPGCNLGVPQVCFRCALGVSQASPPPFTPTWGFSTERSLWISCFPVLISPECFSWHVGFAGKPQVRGRNWCRADLSAGVGVTLGPQSQPRDKEHGCSQCQVGTNVSPHLWVGPQSQWSHWQTPRKLCPAFLSLSKFLLQQAFFFLFFKDKNEIYWGKDLGILIN